MKVHHRLYYHAKHAFIPHEHNEYKPHFFREFSISLIVAITLLLLTVSLGSAVVLEKTEYGASILPSVLIDLTNEHRIANGDSFLSHNETLDKAASFKAEDMAKERYFAHTSPKGVTPWHWFEKAGYTFLFAGENLAVNFTNSEDVENAWMNSPSHRANILNARFKEIGISTFAGVYNDNPTIFVVQMFGVPAIKRVTPPKEIEVVSEVKAKNNASSSKSVTDTKESLPIVKGESKESTVSLEPVTQTRLFASVKNNLPLDEKESKQEVITYSPWYAKALFNISRYVDRFYRVLLVVTALALVVFIVVEIKIQHKKNMAYGALVLLLLVACVYVNDTLALSHMVFLRTFIGG